MENQIPNPSSTKPVEKRSGAMSCIVRRSPRIRTFSSPTEVLKVVESVNLVEDEKEQEPEVHHDSIPPEPNVRILEEKSTISLQLLIISRLRLPKLVITAVYPEFLYDI